jgi:MoaA/NifB/PqqE/SkfB family radical SAM enzyme|tara:strand:- start:933 stop:1595 length:663 start_codon:yes stop_codon:yes gene_type:complete
MSKEIQKELEITKDIQYFMRRKALNIDISFRCPLECPRCQRQRTWRNNGLKVPGRDLTLEEIDKISDYYKDFIFCGQLSDPVHHPKFHKILEMLYEKKIQVEVHNAASQRSKDFYIKCFKAHPTARWVFGIDGLPEESNLYRINQDGEKLFNIMIESKKYLKHRPVWQYIVFSYNENHIEEAKSKAKLNKVDFMLVQSSRWDGDNDPFRPKNKEVSLNAI